MVTKKQTKKMLDVIEDRKLTTKEMMNRIAKVFEVLEKQKIKCEQNFWCCQTCGSSAMDEYANDYEGYCFYHNQDFDGLKKDRYTHLSYNGFKDIDSLEIGKKIMKAFRDKKIKVTWNGKVESRIMVEF
jgi:hypothetical protein